MTGPSWLADVVAVIMLAVAVYCAIRLIIGPIRHRPVEHDVDLVHLGMGVAMAAMFAPRLNPVAGTGWNITWAVIFAVAVVWFVARTVVGGSGGSGGTAGHYLPHAVHSGAMVYMLLAIPAAVSGHSMAGMAMTGMGGPTAGAARFPTLALVLALFMVGYVVLVTDRITPLSAGGAGQDSTPSLLLAPRSAASYKITTGVAMAYMLVTML